MQAMLANTTSESTGANVQAAKEASCDYMLWGNLLQIYRKWLHYLLFSLLTSLRRLLGRCLYAGQAHVLWLILYEHQTNK